MDVNARTSRPAFAVPALQSFKEPRDRWPLSRTPTLREISAVEHRPEPALSGLALRPVGATPKDGVEASTRTNVHQWILVRNN